jgi:DNA-binding transcriptional regulator LsrR (DeoR family)
MKTTEKVKLIIQTRKLTKSELAEKIDISRPTLDKRIIDDSWKKGEVKIIESL